MGVRKTCKVGIGIFLALGLGVLLYVGLIFGSLVLLGFAESAQDQKDWDYYSEDVRSNYMYRLHLYVDSRPDVTTVIDNVTIYVPVVWGKDNLSFSEDFIERVKEDNVYTGKWDSYFVETENGTMIALENVGPIKVHGEKSIVLDNYYETDYLIDTMGPGESALVLPIDNSTGGLSDIYVRYDVSEDSARVNLGLSIEGENSWYGSRRQDSYYQHCHLTLTGAHDGWYRADTVMSAGQGRYPKIREVRSSE